MSGPISATYIASNKFLLAGDRAINFTPGRRVKAHCGEDGERFLTILSAFVTPGNETEVTVKEETLTENLTAVLFGVVGAGARGGLPVHDHSSDDQGGPVGAQANHGGSHVNGGDDIPAFVGASNIEHGQKGLVPAPAIGDEEKALHGDGTWKTPLRASDIRRYALLYRG
jgi:hypothetical protein